jgi:hypothetical protein
MIIDQLFNIKFRTQLLISNFNLALNLQILTSTKSSNLKINITALSLFSQGCGRCTNEVGATGRRRRAKRAAGRSQCRKNRCTAGGIGQESWQIITKTFILKSTKTFILKTLREL